MLRQILFLSFLALFVGRAYTDDAPAKAKPFNCAMTPEMRSDAANGYLSIIKFDQGCSISEPARCQGFMATGAVQCKKTYGECPVSTGCSSRGTFF